MGPLESMLIFINEYLLRLAERDDRFFQNVLGGFTLSNIEPGYSVCGCSSNIQYDLQQVDALNTLIADDMCDKTPVLPLYCDDDNSSLAILGIGEAIVLPDRILSPNLTSSFSFGSGNIPDQCAASNKILASSKCNFMRDQLTASYCLDTSCYNCNCYNQSVNALYGYINEKPSLTIWYNNQVHILLNN